MSLYQNPYPNPYMLPPIRPSRMISIIRNGLEKGVQPRTILVAGAGIAGLVTASLLKEAGHRVIQLEAAERVGGRVRTIRSPFSEGHYLDAGAMRIPSNHYLTWEYIRKFRLSVHPFINGTPKDLIYVNGIRTRLDTYNRNPDLLGFPVLPHERGQTEENLVKQAIQPFLTLWDKADWHQRYALISYLDAYSMETYLKRNPFQLPLSSGAIEMIKVLLDIEGLPEHSFIEIIRILIHFVDPKIQFYAVDGGMDRLPHSFLPLIQDSLHLQHELVKIEQSPHQVTFHTRHTSTGRHYTFTGDFAVVTLPFSILRRVQVEPRESFSHHKWQAIRELHFVPATKIGLQFHTRFWEKEGMNGGKAVSDLPLRFTYYPSYGIGSSEPGVVLASYTWEDDTLPWDSLSDAERVQEALKELAVIHGEQVYREFDKGASFSWLRNAYASGAFSFFKPEQETELAPHICRPEGRVHFAGEQASIHHAWMHGAIESGIRAAWEIQQRVQLP
jgi:monoamine oxidase